MLKVSVYVWTGVLTGVETRNTRAKTSRRMDSWCPVLTYFASVSISPSLVSRSFIHSSLRSLVPVFADKRWIDREDRTSERNVVRVNMRRGIESISTTSLKQPERENTHHEERCFQANTLVGSLLLVTHSFSLLVRLFVPLAATLSHSFTTFFHSTSRTLTHSFTLCFRSLISFTFSSTDLEEG